MGVRETEDFLITGLVNLEEPGKGGVYSSSLEFGDPSVDYFHKLSGTVYHDA
jgi:hypothetical protein